jgi:hypothetical protein
LTRFPLRSTVTSTRSAILMKGMPLFIPYCLRSKAIVPVIDPLPVPLPVIVSVSFSGLVTPRIVKSPSISTVSGPVCTTFALQLAVLHSASGVHAGCLNLDCPKRLLLAPEM